jgi:predicted anti-sigma-YlaC factor YlaD
LISAAHIDSRDLDLYVREKLNAEQSSSIQSHVQNCSVCRENLVNGFLTRLGEMSQEQPGNSIPEKRSERRFHSGEQGSMQLLCPLSLERAAVQIVDVSKDGFGVLVDAFVSAGTIVQIQIGSTISVGTVRSCRAAGQQFHAGIHVRKHVKN